MLSINFFIIMTVHVLVSGATQTSSSHLVAIADTPDIVILQCRVLQTTSVCLVIGPDMPDDVPCTFFDCQCSQGSFKSIPFYGYDKESKGKGANNFTGFNAQLVWRSGNNEADRIITISVNKQVIQGK